MTTKKVVDKLDFVLKNNFLNFKHNDKTNVKLITFKDKICFRGYSHKLQKDDDLIGSNVILNGIDNPRVNNDAANKNYVDTRSWKLPVIVATTHDIKLSELQSIDQIQLKDSDRVLVKDQDLSWQNGIYIVHEDKWIRSDDMPNYANVMGSCVLVIRGHVNKETLWIVTGREAIVGGSPLVFVKLNAVENSTEPSKSIENKPIETPDNLKINGHLEVLGSAKIFGHLESENSISKSIISESIVSNYSTSNKLNVVKESNLHIVNISGTLSIGNIVIDSELFSMSDCVSIDENETHILSKETIIDSDKIIIGNEYSKISTHGQDITIFNVPYYYSEKNEINYYSGKDKVEDLVITGVKIGTYLVTLFIQNILKCSPFGTFGIFIIGSSEGLLKKIEKNFISSGNPYSSSGPLTFSFVITNGDFQDVSFCYNCNSDSKSISFDNSLRTMYLQRIG